MLYGGKFVNVRTRVLRSKRAKSRGYPIEWMITVDNVPKWAIETWRTEKAYGCISDFVAVRNRLKKEIKRAISRDSSRNQG